MIKHPDIYCTRSTTSDDKFNTINCKLPYKMVIDIHMHIMSGHCTPLPLLWNRLPLRHSLGKAPLIGDIFKPEPSTYFLDIAAKVIAYISKVPVVGRIMPTGTMGFVSPLETLAIGKISVGLNEHTFHKSLNDLQGFVLQSKLLTPMITMPMDMEYAHIDGYKGHKIYYKVPYQEYERSWWTLKLFKNVLPPKADIIEDGDEIPQSLRTELNKMRLDEGVEEGKEYSKKTGPFFFFFARATGDDKKNKSKRELKWLGPSEIKVYSSWAEQEKDIRKVTVANPWRLLPMFHYDPRRWQKRELKELKTYLTHTSENGIYIGIKMYTNLGYKPDDPKLPNLRRLYELCVANKIPILCHCTPGGFWTHEREFYLDYEKDENIAREYKHKFWFDDAEEFFWKNFTHPEAWEKVLKLEGLSSLKLCLAHFGGDEWKEKKSGWVDKLIELMKNFENLYVDFSCLYLKNYKRKFLQMLRDNMSSTPYNVIDKILFGTDWYMTQMDSYEYMRQCHDTKNILDEWSEELKIDLWDRFSFVNPMGYLGLKDIADNLKAGITNQLESFVASEDEDSDDVMNAQFGTETPSEKAEPGVKLDDWGPTVKKGKHGLDPIKKKIEEGYNILKNIEI